jgi:hypothetical protein
MVVTVTLTLPLPVAREGGLTVQVVAVAGGGQEKLTGDEKPPIAATEIALGNVAGWPAETVCEVVPVEVMEKSGGTVTVKLKGLEIPPGGGSNTDNGYVPPATPAVDRFAESWVELVTTVELQMRATG